jgi:hypothetical protein
MSMKTFALILLIQVSAFVATGQTSRGTVSGTALVCDCARNYVRRYQIDK